MTYQISRLRKKTNTRHWTFPLKKNIKGKRTVVGKGSHLIRILGVGKLIFKPSLFTCRMEIQYSKAGLRFPCRA